MNPAQIPASSAAVCELALARATIRATNSGGAGRAPGRALDAGPQVAAGPGLRARRDQQRGHAGPAERGQAGVDGGEHRPGHRGGEHRDEQQRPGPRRSHDPASGNDQGYRRCGGCPTVDAGEQGRDRPVAGEHGRRVDVVPGGEHEGALVRPRVRQRELRVVAALAGHGDDVDVEGARPPADQAHPVERRLDLVQPAEQLARTAGWCARARRRSGSRAAAARRPAPSRRPATPPVTRTSESPAMASTPPWSMSRLSPRLLPRASDRPAAGSARPS